MTRYIDAEELKRSMLFSKDVYENVNEDGLYEVFCVIDEQPTIDAVPSEMLYDIIKQIGSITYGKERFFEQDHGIYGTTANTAIT